MSLRKEEAMSSVMKDKVALDEAREALAHYDKKEKSE